MNVDLKILDSRIGNEFTIPKYAKEGDAGIDLLAMIDDSITLYPGEMHFVNTGIAISMPENNMMGMIVPRSGSGSKGLVLKNGTGIIDSGYRGEIKLVICNSNPIKYRFNKFSNRISVIKENGITIAPGDRIAQLIFVPIIRTTFNIVDTLDETSRGEGGFSSTGKSSKKKAKETEIIFENEMGE